MLNKKKINDYLYFSYLFPSEFPKWLIDFDTKLKRSHSYTVKEASSLFDSVIDDSLEEIQSNNYCIVPISGGWDSRILLAAAVERFDTSNIKTYSFGTPGQLDYDIGGKIAGVLGIEHTAIDLRNVPIDWHQLEQTAAEAPWTRVLDTFFNRYCAKKISESGDFILSGFMGDPLTGSHTTNTVDKDKIIRRFVKRQRVANNPGLLENNYDPMASIPEIPDTSMIPLGELLDFGIRQACMVAPIVTPSPEMNRWQSLMGTLKDSQVSVVSPFTHPKWASYWAAAPVTLKKNQKFFFELFESKYPDLFHLPSKENFGASKNSGFEFSIRRNLIRAQNRLHILLPRHFKQSNKMLNYQDFDEVFRSRDDYKKVLRQALSYLKEHTVVEWIDLDQMWEEHMSYQKDYAKSFQVLIGLALNLSAGNDFN